MVTWLLLGLVLHLAYVFTPAALFLPAEGLMRHMGSRDDLPEPGALVGRARRALANWQESLPIFATLGILALVVDGADMAQAVLGAQIFVLARAAYLVLYLISIPMTRSVAWTAAVFGLGMMALALI